MRAYVAVSVALLVVVMLLAGCESGSIGEGGFDASVLEGDWEGMLFVPGGDSVAWLDAQFDGQGNVIDGFLSGGNFNGAVMDGQVASDGHSFTIRFENGGRLDATSITIDGDTITGAGTLILPSGGGTHSVSFSLTRPNPD